MIPFSPPKIYQEIIDEVVDTLKSGWLTTGPKTKQFEQKLADYCSAPKVLCLNSSTIGMELTLRWFGIKEGDEVLLPAYTYCATANVVLHCGATPIMVDINDDFTIDLEDLKKKITSKTKVIIPVDIGGLPCDYDSLNHLIRSEEVIKHFTPTNEEQRQLGRILLMDDAAHSLGATYKGNRIGTQADVSVFSFHAVKNLTTGEGGAVVLNLPKPFDNNAIYSTLNTKSLHGQNKDALAKTQKGNWRYDVVEAGYKANMTDMAASLGLVELKYYDSETIKRRKEIFDRYSSAFAVESWATIPHYKDENRESSYHLYLLRINGITEQQRDDIITQIFEQDVSVNVHYQPLPMLTQYKNLDYKMDDYPKSFQQYSTEITLPVYFNLSNDQVDTVILAVKNAYQMVVGND
jgi:dTDP-4-amino-4,6-dideoxygalactose transaminase